MEKTATIIIRAAGEIITTAALAAAVLILALALYTELESYRIIAEADSVRYSTYKPTADDTVTFDELLELNGDVVGWIMIDGTGIDYPIVQGSSNEEYINKNVFGEFSLSGAIFLDYRCSAGFTDPLSVIYGHNMTGGVMFGGLKEFENKEYFDSHRSGTLYCGGEYYRLEIFSCFTANGHDPTVYRIPLNAEAVGDWTERILSLSECSAEDMDTDAPILLMSTCSSGQTDERTLLAAHIRPGGSPFVKNDGAVPDGGLIRLADKLQSGFGAGELIAAALVWLALTVIYVRIRRKSNGQKHGA